MQGIVSLQVEFLHSLVNFKVKIQDKELSEVEASDAIDNAKPKIQDKGLSSYRFNLQMQFIIAKFLPIMLFLYLPFF
jgi:hypothetical protein